MQTETRQFTVTYKRLLTQHIDSLCLNNKVKLEKVKPLAYLLKSRGRFHAEIFQFSNAACVFLVRRARTNAHGGGIEASAAGWAWLTSNATSICVVVSVSRAGGRVIPFHGLMPVRYRSAIWWDRVNFATAPAPAPAAINNTIRDVIDRGAISHLHSLMRRLLMQH